jgi:predicted Zn-dependent protease
MRLFLSSAALSVLLASRVFAQAAADAPPDPNAVVPALEAELNRSMSRLKLDEFGPPYFLGYRLRSERSWSFRSYFGETSYRGRQQRDDLYVESRFGSPQLDNVDDDYNGSSASAPVEVSTAALRQKAWELTDIAYKRALSGFLAKKAKRAQELEEEKLPDFSTAPVVREISPPPMEHPNGAQLEALLNRVTSVFKKYAPLQEGEASLDYTWASQTYVTSEGTRLSMEEEHLPVSIYVAAKTRAPDGQLLQQFETWSATSLDKLPSEAALTAGAERVAQKLMALREAPVQAPINAPAIFDPVMTGVFFHEALGHRLEGQRQRDPEESQLFKGRVGETIIPSFLSLLDDPSLENWHGEPMNGYYKYDDEAVASRRVTLIDHGVLKGFLTSRRPVPGVPFSNGHGRSDAWHHPIGRMGTLIVEAEGGLSSADLKKRLMAEAQKRGAPYGFMLIGAVGGDNPTERRSAQTLRVQPKTVVRVDAKTGAETLVRGVELVGTPLVVVNRAVAAGSDMVTDNTGSCGAASGWVSVSEIAPSLLIGEIELQRLPENRERPPILASPLHDDASALSDAKKDSKDAH